eukprot:gnl/Chilomastix_caulleri/7498.p2 GENE.gnl/Chilomastix_caulleri/7498~~gnl/Chilomastix_caulleri/7498.p2  ORF type:complete len:64 (+),score=19.27 gnl/Chilomastix_caulleri/7498:296-487(+)
MDGSYEALKAVLGSMEALHAIGRGYQSYPYCDVSMVNSTRIIYFPTSYHKSIKQFNVDTKELC